jgi:hypothetical protein
MISSTTTTTSTIAPSIPITSDPHKELMEQRRFECEELLRISNTKYKPGENFISFTFLSFYQIPIRLKNNIQFYL